MKFGNSILSLPADLKKYKYLIGIDPGVQTGITIYCRTSKKIRHISTVKIHAAMKAVEFWHGTNRGEVFIRIEDARKRKWFGNAGREQLQGAGSIKRDCSIWEDFCEFIGIDFEMVAPKNNNTKMKADYFKKLTGYQGATSEHARDSAALVFGF